MVLQGFRLSLRTGAILSLPALEYGAPVFDAAEKFMDMLDTPGHVTVLDEERPL